MTNTIRYDGRVAVVTGAGGGALAEGRLDEPVFRRENEGTDPRRSSGVVRGVWGRFRG